MDEPTKGKALIGGYVPVDFYEHAKAAAKDAGLTVTAMLVQAVHLWMKQQQADRAQDYPPDA